jgi:UDP-2-acetamido-2-deoxy-ribo-hexuluronate aminotransferase
VPEKTLAIAAPQTLSQDLENTMSGSQIPFFGVDRQYLTLREEILDAVDQVYRSGQVLDGDSTRRFEGSMARRCDRRYAVAVNSATQGLVFAQQVHLLRESSVLIPTLSFAATINSVLYAGNAPVFCDTDDSALIDLESMDMALTGAGVTAIMYANLFGHVVDYDRFRLQTEFFNSNICVIEDAAQSFGARYKDQPSGSLGDISVLSFDPTKNLNNYGSGGMVLTDDVDVYHQLLNLRDNGKYLDHCFIGTNSKMSESDSAQMLVKLKYFDAWQTRRQAIAEYYTQELAEWADVVLPGEHVVSAWSKFVIRLSERHGLRDYLQSCGIDSRFHYDRPLFELPIGYDYIDYARELFRESTAFSREAISLPIYPELTDLEVERVVNSVKNYLR